MPGSWCKRNLQKMLPDLVDPFWISAMLAFSTCKRSAVENLTTPLLQYGSTLSYNLPVIDFYVSIVLIFFSVQIVRR